ncbi:LytTR family transcriptional regulator DNA-binding domain-containing protein [Maricaulis sp.]|uniref:LytTR family transcriptional regulator DNA-binding domain-containing protein n=1 Tax=Maricaulis sp. TaxID=1486257 RepID=UPI0034138A24
MGGYQAHRSWWVTQTGIEAASFKRGSGSIALKGGLTAPVSRTFAPALREAGILPPRRG